MKVPVKEVDQSGEEFGASTRDKGVEIRRLWRIDSHGR